MIEKNKIESCLQDSPPAAGRFSDMIPIRRSAILAEPFYVIGNSGGISYYIKTAPRKRRAVSFFLYHTVLVLFNDRMVQANCQWINFRAKDSKLRCKPAHRRISDLMLRTMLMKARPWLIIGSHFSSVNSPILPGIMSAFSVLWPYHPGGS